MIKCQLFEFVTSGGKGVISAWVKKHPQHRGAMKARTDDLRKYGVGSEETLPWCCHEGDGIYKLKVRAKPQFRPHLCKGPISIDSEATLLATAIEENFTLEPSDIMARSKQRRAEIEADQNRRKPYGRDQE